MGSAFVFIFIAVIKLQVIILLKQNHCLLALLFYTHLSLIKN